MESSCIIFCNLEELCVVFRSSIPYFLYFYYTLSYLTLLYRLTLASYDTLAVYSQFKCCFFLMEDVAAIVKWLLCLSVLQSTSFMLPSSHDAVNPLLISRALDNLLSDF